MGKNYKKGKKDKREKETGMRDDNPIGKRWPQDGIYKVCGIEGEKKKRKIRRDGGEI